MLDAFHTVVVCGCGRRVPALRLTLAGHNPTPGRYLTRGDDYKGMEAIVNFVYCGGRRRAANVYSR